MTEAETVMLCFIVFQRVMLFLLIALQKSLNNTVRKTLALIMKGQQ